MSNGERVERAALALILTVVGLAAGAAAFTHMHDWTMANSPHGTADWFGWANACISELVPVAALLTIRQRRRAGRSTTYPMFLLMVTAMLSLAAQLAVAQPSPSGWLLSAVPALAFIVLPKLVFSGKSPADDTVTGKPNAAVPATPMVDSDAATEPVDLRRCATSLVVETPASMTLPAKPAHQVEPLAEDLEPPELPKAAPRPGVTRVRPRVLTRRHQGRKSCRQLAGERHDGPDRRQGWSERIDRSPLPSPRWSTWRNTDDEWDHYGGLACASSG
jgi:hypothetical protein